MTRECDNCKTHQIHICVDPSIYWCEFCGCLSYRVRDDVGEYKIVTYYTIKEEELKNTSGAYNEN